MDDKTRTELEAAVYRRLVEHLRTRTDVPQLNPDTIMPPYYRIGGLNRVAPSFRGRPVLTAEQIEDVVAFLSTLRE